MKKLFLILSIFIAMPALAITTGEQAPEFELVDYTGNAVTLADFKGSIIVLEWFNNGCPFVKKHYKDGHMQALQKKFSEKGVVWLTINSTNSDHKDYLTSAKAMQVQKDWKIDNAKMLRDELGIVGEKYDAKTTPHMYIIDTTGKLVYQGAIDDEPGVWASPEEANNYVAKALEEVLAGKPVTTGVSKAYGCSVKY